MQYMFAEIQSIIDFENYAKDTAVDNAYYLYGVHLKMDISPGYHNGDYFDIAYYKPLCNQITFYSDEDLCNGEYTYDF